LHRLENEELQNGDKTVRLGCFSFLAATTTRKSPGVYALQLLPLFYEKTATPLMVNMKWKFKDK